MPIIFNWDIVIDRCTKKHKGRYLYDKKDQLPYKNIAEKMIIECKEHGKFPQIIGGHLRGQGCPECLNNQMRLGWDSILDDCRDIHNNQYIYYKEEQPKYVNVNDTKMVIHCKIHGVFLQSVTHHKHSTQGCPECGDAVKGDYNKLNWDIIFNDCKIAHNNVYNYYIDEQPEYKTVDDTKMVIHCPIHGIFHQTVWVHRKAQGGCPKCTKSNGVKSIERILNSHNIANIDEHPFEDCCGESRVLRFDFYLPDYNILIEYDGIQHYEYSPEFFHKKGYWQFEKQQHYDEIKNQYAEENDIPLIRIRYDVEYIEEYLEAELEELGVL